MCVKVLEGNRKLCFRQSGHPDQEIALNYLSVYLVICVLIFLFTVRARLVIHYINGFVPYALFGEWICSVKYLCQSAWLH